jgi:comEA protein
MKRSKMGRGTVSRWARAAGVVLGVAVLLATASTERARAEQGTPVDLNSASASELESLPGIGPSKAQAIIAHREVAPFKRADELVEVKGIGEKLYAQLKDRVTVAAAPANPGRDRAKAEPAGGAVSDAKGARSGPAAGAR